MPIIDKTFQPNVPLTAAERPVRWRATNAHILRQRVHIEQATVQLARRIGFLAGARITPTVQVRELADKLAAELASTYEFGRRESKREIAGLRAGTRPPVQAVREADARPRPARRRFEDRAQEVARDVEKAGSEAEGEVEGATAAVKQLHHGVLTLVGEALNLGRTRGALEAAGGPPTFAMRSEQLDKTTCQRCQALHGTIYQLDSAEFYEALPPADCLGGGRCRGVMVFADGVRDLRRT